MNKYRILIALALVVVLLTVAGCGAADVDPTTTPTEGASIPSNEGNEPIDPPPENEGVSHRPTGNTTATQATEATQPGEIENTKPTENTDPTQATAPTEPENKPCCDYAVYLALSPADQQKFMGTFSNTMDFVQWCRQGEAAHKEHDDTITSEGEEFDISDILDKINGKS